MRCYARTPCPESEGQEQPHGPTSKLRRPTWYGATLSPHHQAQRHSRHWSLHTPWRGTPRRLEAPRAPHGHGHRTSCVIHASALSPGEAVSNRPAYGTSTTRPSAQARNTSQQPLRRIPTGSLREHVPTPSRLGSEDPPTDASAQGPRKLFPIGARHPSENSRRIRVSLSSLALSLARRLHPPRKAPRGRAQTRGGRQPWERASTRGRTRQSART